MLTGEQFDRTRCLALTLAGIERMVALLATGKNGTFSLYPMSVNSATDILPSSHSLEFSIL